EGRPLVEQAAVSYQPSASALGGLGAGAAGRNAGGARLRLLGVGDPLLARSSQGGAAAPETLLAARFDLPPMPSAGRELAAAARQLGGSSYLILTGSQATEQGFRTAAAKGARVMHLATHAVADERPGRGAAVLLTPQGRDDGLLVPEEIAALDAGADLTVLAACSTALGATGWGRARTDGRALASLTGAFLASGSRGVVATLWDVGDQATAVFMEQLYHELARGRTPAEALRRVKLRLRSDPRWSRPELWAGYVLVGEPPAVARPWWTGFLAGLGGAGLLLAAGLWVRRRRLA
ncbi:MAG TPA: CHAT domain-containing protein, partial [Thermoanaerobaculia bacterium]|nr:CHAT domain-containing protein [Thermoanaerobaculia bacterium]